MTNILRIVTLYLSILFTAQLVAPPPATAQTIPPIRHTYLAVGDSLTVGLYAAEGRGFTRIVADRLPPGYAFEIQAVTGAGIQNTLAQLPTELTDHHPDLVTVEVGINNLGTMNVSEFAVNYLRLLNKIAEESPGATVVVCTVPWTGQIQLYRLCACARVQRRDHYRRSDSCLSFGTLLGCPAVALRVSVES